MEGKAKAKYVSVSPRKVRQVAQLLKGKGVEEALNVLHFSIKAPSHVLEKTLRSAVANAMAVKEIRVDEGPMRKWIRPRAMGRATRVRRRSSHITVVVAD
jgi:large subunit ribosomal protein L22